MLNNGLIAFAGAHNHKYFLGFLASLLGLCIVILSASVQYWQFECWSNLTNGHSADNYLVAAATCDAWVMWIAANTSLHSFWVGTLLACQCYQVKCDYNFIKCTSYKFRPMKESLS